MANKPFLSAHHFIVKAMAEVQYPITKEALIQQVGHKTVQIDWNQFVPMKNLISIINFDEFDCASTFFDALTAAILSQPQQ